MAKKKQTPQTPSVLIWALAVGIVLSVGAGALFLSQQRTAATSIVVKHDTMPEHTPPQPDWLMNAMQPVKEAYYFAARHPDKLQYIPCYCGCSHASNAECYFKWDNQRNITAYEQHAYGWQICVDITRDVMTGLTKGKSLTQMRTDIDKRYQAQGMKPTPTPMPPSGM